QRNTVAKILDDLLASGVNVTKRNVHNEIQKLRLTEPRGRSMIEALLDFLEK
ncbi:hypothetical protein EJ02DRAFT_309709, partial [Clathrospora elynae]